MSDAPNPVKKQRSSKKAAPASPAPSQPIRLLPTQVDHVERLTRIFDTSMFAFDFSMMGAGKTFSSSYIALNSRFAFKHVIVIAPVSVQSKWMDMQKRYGVPVAHNLSYSSLRSVKHHQPKHGLLHRRDYIHPVRNTLTGMTTDTERVEFTASDELTRLLEEGTLLVIDEMQNVKNLGSQFDAAQALIKALRVNFETGSRRSRLIMMSASPIDRPEQVIHLYRILGIMASDRITQYNIRTNRTEWVGAREIEDECHKLNADQTRQIRYRHPNIDNGRALRDTGVRSYLYDLFQEVLKPALSSTMLPPETVAQIYKYNACYEVQDRADRQLLAQAIAKLGDAAGYNDETNTVDYMHAGNAAEALRAISTAMLQIETAKINTFVRVAREALEADPHRKVVICVNYSSTVHDLVERLAAFRPLLLDGSIPVGKRGEVIHQFQQPTAERRLLIGNVSVCSTGIDLDDKDGAYPRLALISPNFSTITLYQLGHRFLRADTKSDATIHFLFGKQAVELHILNALAHKSAVMKETTQEQAEYGIVFPGEYEMWQEPEAAAGPSAAD